MPVHARSDCPHQTQIIYRDEWVVASSRWNCTRSGRSRGRLWHTVAPHQRGNRRLL